MVLNLSKIFACSVFTVLSLIATAQNRPISDTNYIDPKGRKQGVWKKIDKTGVRYIGQFKDDKPYGRFTHFDSKGRISMISNYFRDGFASQTTFFHPNGKISASGFYLDKLRDSVWQIYDSVGRILKTEHYLNGMLHGLTELYDQDNQCVETQEWFRGLRNGLWWQKIEIGSQSTTYKLNKSHGAYMALYPDEKPAIKGQYEDGQREGIWYFYHTDGTLDRIMQFKQNQLVKKQVSIHVDGTDRLLNTDSVAYVHTNGKISEIQLFDGTTYRPTQSFEKLVKSFDTDYFFLANPRFLASFNAYASLELLPTDDEDSTSSSEFVEGMDSRPPQKAILQLKIPTPYEVIVDEEVIGMLQNITSSKPVEDE